MTSKIAETDVYPPLFRAIEPLNDRLSVSGFGLTDGFPQLFVVFADTAHLLTVESGFAVDEEQTGIDQAYAHVDGLSGEVRYR